MNSVMSMALQVDQVTIDPSLRLYIPFNEGVGDVAKDYSQYGNNGVFTDVEWGINGGIFNGTSAYINCGNNGSLDITEAITIEAWVKSTGSGLRGYAGSTANNYGIFIDADNRINLYKGTSILRGDSILSADIWYHIVLTYNGTASIFYLNGTFEKSEVVDGSLRIQYIGTDMPNDEPFDGTIDQVKIYNRALSALEVLSHYKGGRAMHDILADYFKLGQGKLGISLLG